MRTGKALADFIKLWAMIVVLVMALAVGLGVDIYPIIRQVFAWLTGG